MVTNKEIKTLDSFLKRRGIDYVLTGTCALFYHGFLPKNTQAQDIDIIVLTTKSNRGEIREFLQELQKLSECDNSLYPDAKCITFKVVDVKVNAFEGDVLGEDYPSHQSMVIDDTLINVHDVMKVLQAKFKLGRNKDFAFCNALIANILKFFNN